MCIVYQKELNVYRSQFIFIFMKTSLQSTGQQSQPFIFFIYINLVGVLNG